MLAMLSGIGDGLAEVMAHALDFISLDIEQGLKTYTTIVKVSVAPRGLSHGVSDLYTIQLGPTFTIKKWLIGNTSSSIYPRTFREFSQTVGVKWGISVQSQG